jgi:hypothetical protein
VQAEALVKAQQEVGEVMGELGLAFIKLAKYETEAGYTPVHAAEARCVATAAVKASRFYRECNAQSVQHLVRPQSSQFAFLPVFVCCNASKQCVYLFLNSELPHHLQKK